jgi:hypothetical protein
VALSRQALFAALGLIQIVEPLTDRVYAELERKIWEDDLESSPHGQPWHTSFHASSFPGDEQTACGRRQVYSLLNVPEPAPTSRFLRSVGDAGKAIEDELVSRWGRAGILLSADADSVVQSGFTDPEHWLTGNTDAAILPYRWNRPHIVEVKSKAKDKVEEMRMGRRGPDPKHRNQCLTYIGLAHEQHPWKHVWICSKRWRIIADVHRKAGKCPHCSPSGEDTTCATRIDLEPALSGSIFYLSRDDPSITHEFVFHYDEEFLAQGRARIAEWRDNFLEGKLPDRPQHADGKVVGWSEEPCKWCPMKKHVCKPDWQNKINSLELSHAVEHTKKIRPGYDVNNTTQAVKDRWNAQG